MAKKDNCLLYNKYKISNSKAFLCGFFSWLFFKEIQSCSSKMIWIEQTDKSLIERPHNEFTRIMNKNYELRY